MDIMYLFSGFFSLDEKSYVVKEISCLVCFGRDGVYVCCILILKV